MSWFFDNWLLISIVAGAVYLALIFIEKAVNKKRAKKLGVDYKNPLEAKRKASVKEVEIEDVQI